MCTQLYIRNENHSIEQACELAAVIGRENILYFNECDEVVTEPAEYANSDLAWCLCPVAIEETLSRLCYTVVDGWNEPERVDYVAFLADVP